MKTKYLAYSQATVISSDHQHIVGLPFGEERDYVVNAVTVAPYSRILQWSFVRQLLKGVPLQDALSLCPDRRYDVIVISVNPTNRLEFKIKDLRTYLFERSLAFDATRYRCHYVGATA